MTITEKLIEIDKNTDEVIALNSELEQTLYGTDTGGTLPENVRQVNADFVGIKNKLIANGVEVVDGTPTSEYAGKVDEVYNKGKQDENDAFWDAYQVKGTRTACQFIFSTKAWNDSNFKPKYSMKAANASQMFSNCDITDIKGVLESRGLTFSTTGSSSLNYLCYNAKKLTRFPTLDAAKATNTSGITYSFYDCQALTSIDKIILATGSHKTAFGSAFVRCYALEEIRFSGNISQNIDFQYSTKLSKASLESIMNALYLDGTSTKSLTITLSATAVNKAFETSDGANDGADSDEWTALKNEKTNWTISLI